MVSNNNIFKDKIYSPLFILTNMLLVAILFYFIKLTYRAILAWVEMVGDLTGLFLPFFVAGAIFVIIIQALYIIFCKRFYSENKKKKILIFSGIIWSVVVLVVSYFLLSYYIVSPAQQEAYSEQRAANKELLASAETYQDCMTSPKNYAGFEQECARKIYELEHDFEGCMELAQSLEKSKASYLNTNLRCIQMHSKYTKNPNLCDLILDIDHKMIQENMNYRNRMLDDCKFKATRSN